MTCKKARKLVPLLAGDDLGRRRTSRLQAHLDSCPSCREELSACRRAVETMKAAAREEAGPAWPEPAWQALISGIEAEASMKEVHPPVMGWKWAWAAGLVLLIFLAGGYLFKDLLLAPGGRRNLRPEPTSIGKEKAQDSLSVTLVSQETGLQVVWVFSKDFEWKGDEL